MVKPNFIKKLLSNKKGSSKRSFSNDIYSYNIDRTIEKNKLNIYIHLKKPICVDFFEYFSNDVMETIRQNCDHFILSIVIDNSQVLEYNVNFNKNEDTEFNDIKVWHDEENKNEQYFAFRLIEMHLKNVFKDIDINLQCDSKQMWVIRLLYKMFLDYKLLEFSIKDRKIAIENMQSFHKITMQGSGNLNFIDRNLKYEVCFKYTTHLKNSIDRYFKHIIRDLHIIRLKLININEVKLNHAHLLKELVIQKINSEDADKDTFNDLTRFVDTLIIKKLKIKDHQKFQKSQDSFIFSIFNSIFSSPIRKLSLFISKGSHIALKNDDFFSYFVDGLKQMNQLIVLKILGAKKMFLPRINELMTNDKSRLKVLETDFQWFEKEMQAVEQHFETSINNNIYKLSLSLEEPNKSLIGKLMDKLVNLTNLKIDFSNLSCIDQSYLHPNILQKKSGKLYQIRINHKTGGPVDPFIQQMTDINSFDKIPIKGTFEEIENRHGQINHMPDLNYYKNIYYNNSTLAHYFSKYNNSILVNKPEFNHLESITDLKRGWHPSAYLSNRGNPIVKEMFKCELPLNQCGTDNLGSLDFFIILDIFLMIGDSMWDETILCNLSRVNKNFHNCAMYYKKLIENRIRKRNNMKEIDLEKDCDVFSKKRKRVEEIEDVNQNEPKKRKINILQ